MSLIRAVENNAHWCDALASAHGAQTEYANRCWINRGAAPPYTPQLITLDGPEHARDHLEAVARLCAKESGGSLHVKDSFASLDLVPLGFELLFEAKWIAAAPADRAATVRADASPLRWSCASDDAELASWERVWRANGAQDALAGYARVFPPGLLARPGLHFLMGMRRGEVRAVAALNRSTTIVGLTNAMTRDGDFESVFAACLAQAHDFHPGVAVVGYEQGDALLAALAAGFRALHPLRVWRAQC